MKKRFLFAWAIIAVSSVALAQTAVIRSGALKAYEAPDESAREVMTLTVGDTVKVAERQGAWVKLRLPGKRFGWMRLTESASQTLFKKSRPAQNGNGLRPPQNQSPDAPTSLATAVAPGVAGEGLAPEQSLREMPASETQMQTAPTFVRPANDLTLGISFTLGAIGENFAYSGRFLYRSLPSLYLEGSFQHVPGDVAASLLLHSNALYTFSLSREAGWEGWITGGLGVISTSPTKTVGAKSVSNMEINYGIGARRYLKHRTYLRADLRQFSVLLDNATKNYVEFAVGIIIGVR